MRRFSIFFLISAVMVLVAGCAGGGAGDSGGSSELPDIEVIFQSATQTGGTSDTVDSTELILSFDVDPATLTADDITVTGAMKGALSGTGTTRTLAISNITVANGETVSVSIANPSGYSIGSSPQTAVVYKAANAITFQNVTQAGGSDGTADSTSLTLSFSADPTTLTADDINVTGATKGALSGSGTTRTLAITNITVANGETVSVAITSPSGYSISGSPRTAAVYKTAIAITFQNATQTGGVSGTADSTGLTLSFDADPATLTADDITVTGATKGALTGSGTTRSLAISAVAVANGETVSVAITSPTGYSFTGSPKTAVVYRAPMAVTFQSAVQTGGTSGTTDSTGLTLSFNVDPTTLTAGNITLTGATKGMLTGSGTTRSLAISDITVGNGETVSVVITSPSGFTISGSPNTAVVYRAPTAVNFQSAVQTGGTSGTVDSTGLTLTFDTDPTTLTAGNISVTGATKGSLTGSGTTRSLTISSITVGNGETVSVSIVSPPGYSINGTPRTTVVYRAPTAVIFTGATQAGGTSGTADSTGLTMTFDVAPTTLSASDITVTGATKGALSGIGTTRTLAISNITVGNGETVSVAIASPSGFTISGSPKTATVYKDTRTAVTFTGVTQNGGISYTTDTEYLNLTFDVTPTTLSVNDIIVTGATKNWTSGSNPISLVISNITVGDGETVSVAISNPPGYKISGSPQTAVVYRAPYVGMAYQGGIIAYILQAGDPGYVSGETHGLIAATGDQSTGIAWILGGSAYNTWNWGTLETLGTGQANTTAMMDQPEYTGGAAKVCDDYTNANTGTGVYSDWYLPSKDELHKLYLNKEAIGGFVEYDGIYYWSSSEDSSASAWAHNFDTDQQAMIDKWRTLRVRPVRSF
jgi:large repetitive protein